MRQWRIVAVAMIFYEKCIFSEQEENLSFLRWQKNVC